MPVEPALEGYSRLGLFPETYIRSRILSFRGMLLLLVQPFHFNGAFSD